MATQIRFKALDNQCTGAPDYQGRQDADPLNATDCDSASDQGTVLHAAEFEVFGQPRLDGSDSSRPRLGAVPPSP